MNRKIVPVTANRTNSCTISRKLLPLLAGFALLVLTLILAFPCLADSKKTDQNPKSKLILDQEKLTLDIGDTYKLEAKAITDQDTEKMPDAVWKSSNKKVAAVTQNGKVTAKSEGTATITIKAGKLSSRCKITVKKSVDTKRQELVEKACSYAGKLRYRYGGTSLKTGVDCSGFVRAIYKTFGYTLPHSSYAQRSVGKKIALKDRKPGDIICYSGHVGIYIGDNKIVHAANRRSGVRISSWTHLRVRGVRRVILK